MRGIISGRIAVAVSVLVLASCQSKTEDDYRQMIYASFCSRYAGNLSDPCEVSAHALASHPAAFDGKVVRATGFYTKGLGDVIFLDRESSEYSVFKNAFIITKSSPKNEVALARRQNSYITVVGTFKNPLRVRGEFSQRTNDEFAGEIEIARVEPRKASKLPYACWNPSNPHGNGVKTLREVLGERVCQD